MRVTILLFAITIILLLPLLLAPVVTKAQSAVEEYFQGAIPVLCTATKAMLEILKKHNEVAVAGGALTAIPGSHVFVYRTEDKESWSIVAHYASGKSCFLAVGADWYLSKPVKGDGI
jgi:hypothetical protein